MDPMLQVFLRNGGTATVDSRVHIGEYRLQGRLSSGQLELWTADGQCNQDLVDGPLDIIAFTNSRGELQKVTGPIPI